MNTGRAFVAGVAAAAVASGIILLLRTAGLSLGVHTQLSTVFGLSSWIVGLAIFLLIGGVIAFGYAAFFEWAIHQAGIGPGILVGACHTILAGFAWALTSEPGKFWVHFGAGGIAALFLVHLVYGAVVGGLYHTKHTLAH